ncbi:MAG: hypothetical protein WD231_01220 [Candidatus Woykebacteria bacterium]
MNVKSARILFLFSLFLFALVGLDISFLSSNENKAVSDKKVSSEQGSVLPGYDAPSYYYKFYLKDASAVSEAPGLITLINNQEKDSSLITGATIVVLNKSAFHCGDGGTSYTFAEYSGLYKLICQEEATMQLQISKSGYQTKYTSLERYDGDIPTISLSRYVPPPPPPETIKDITLPKEFKEKGSKTTNLSKIKDTKKVQNLTLDTKKATIKFKETLNLSSTDTKNKFKKLDSYLDMDKTAVVGLNSKALPVLNKKATITMKGLPWVKEPKVLADGKEDKSIVSNINYANGTLTFDAAHFSTFKAAPSITVTEPSNNFSANVGQINLKGSVSDPTASVSAKLNNRSLGNLKVATASGEFSTNLDLAEGLNKIVINAVSSNGATSAASITGTFTLVLKSSSNLYLYFILGFLALLAIGFMIYFFWKVKKDKGEESLQRLPKV